MKKKDDSKLTPVWRGPYRVIENLKEHTVPEASISRPLVPEARLPYRTPTRHDSLGTIPQDQADEDTVNDNLTEDDENVSECGECK